MTLSPGARLGPYEILSTLGAGGMGEVYKARDTRLNREVAVKRLLQHSERFEQEARTIAALNHPHICQIYDIGPDYLVMEYIDGTPLHGPVPADEAVRLAIQIASALEEAHHKHILHRDLKPGNIVVTPKGTAKLLDFGLARLMEGGDETRSIAASGTPLYMSPEQIENQPLDARSDVFSFGAVLYELLSGRRAFDSVGAVLRDTPAPLEGPVGGIALRCLAKQPTARFQTIAEVKGALGQLTTMPSSEQPSIAVLPFADMSPGKDHEWFSDGIAEEIINLLAHIPGLKVIARTSAFAFKGQPQDIRRIAETLGVAHVLEGSVRKAGNRVRVTAQLIAAADGRHLWSERYDRELADVFAVQDDIAAAIARVLHATLVPSAPTTRSHTPPLEAYEAVLKARYLLSRMTPDTLATAKGFYEEAIRLDPAYALPYAGLGWLQYAAAFVGVQPARLAMPVARDAAVRALAIDASLVDAHALAGMVAAVFDYDWSTAARHFQVVDAHGVGIQSTAVWYGTYLVLMGRPREALVQLERAVAGDPLSAGLRISLAVGLWYAGRVTDAMQECRGILALDERQYAAHFNLGMMYYAEGDLGAALACEEAACVHAPWNTVARGALAGFLRRSGDDIRADEELRTLGDGSTYHAEVGLMLYYLIGADYERAADWVEKAIDQREPSLLVLLGGPVAKPLRVSARWPALAKRMNLPS